MKITIISFMLMISANIFAKGDLITEPTNSPVRESYAKFKLSGIDNISKVYFKPKNGSTEFEGKIEKINGNIIGSFKTNLLPVGEYEYRVRVTVASGSSENSNAKSVSFVSFSIDPSLEVADPGPEGEKTLLGIDKDSNGIRDDVQRWINESGYNINVKNALKQISKNYQNLIANVEDKALSRELIKKGLDAVGCLDYLSGNDQLTALTIIKKMKVEFYNTKERLIAGEKADKNWHEATSKDYDTFATEDKTKCNFPIKN